MAGGSQTLKSDKPSIKYRCNPLDGAFIELANFECEGYAPTSSESSKQNGKVSEPKSPDILSTRELVSAIGHVWDCATRPLSALLSKRSARYNGGHIQNGKVLPYLTGQRTCSTCSTADDEYISYNFSSNGDSSSMMPENLEYLRVTEKISLVEHSRRHYSVFWRLLQGRSDVPQESWDGKGLRCIGVPYDLRNIYGWMNDVAPVTPQSCVISAEIENDKLGDCCVGNESTNPADCCNSVDSTSSANKVIIEKADCHTDVANNVDSPLFQKASPVSIIRASNTTLQVEDDVRSLQSIDANTSIPCIRLETESDLKLSADHNCASEEGKCRTDEVLPENNKHQPMKATEHNPEAELCVSSKEKAHYMTAKREHAFAGAMAGICVSLCLHPVDTIKTVVQSCRANQNSLHHIGKSIVLERGVTGLYRGISSNIASSAPISAIYTFTYESVKGALLPLFPKEYQSLAHCMAGGCASIATSFIFTPSERVKQQMQVGSHYQNCWIALIKIIEKGGFPSLYAGWGAVLCRNVPHSIIKFYTYESLKQLMFPAVQSGVQTNTLVALTCGGLAGSTAAFFTTPFDVVKTRLQTQVPGSINQYDGVLNTLKDIGKREGLKGLYRGLTPRLFMYMTQGALFFASYESFKRLFSLEVAPLSSQKVPRKQRTQEDSISLPSQEHDCISCLAN